MAFNHFTWTRIKQFSCIVVWNKYIGTLLRCFLRHKWYHNVLFCNTKFRNLHTICCGLDINVSMLMTVSNAQKTWGSFLLKIPTTNWVFLEVSYQLGIPQLSSDLFGGFLSYMLLFSYHIIKITESKD